MFATVMLREVLLCNLSKIVNRGSKIKLRIQNQVYHYQHKTNVNFLKRYEMYKDPTLQLPVCALFDDLY